MKQQGHGEEEEGEEGEEEEEEEEEEEGRQEGERRTKIISPPSPLM